MPVFTPGERSRLRSQLLERARSDAHISAAAVTGSAATDAEDRWSDIDLALAVSDAAALPEVLGEWTEEMYARHDAVDHTDLPHGPWLYRVFLRRDTLQVDLAFVAQDHFRALAPSFRLIFGEAQPPEHAAAPERSGLIGMAWLHALHVRSCLARNQLWQAEYMLAGVRSNALALACLRHGLPTAHGRGFDRLPVETRSAFAETFARGLDAGELRRAFVALLGALRAEIGRFDADLAGRLAEPLTRMAD
ncbi:MAG TPA: hypothetical protein DEH78_00100 [Solibacterales bacterium]|nr:hypothetical protein [Bryobacterales bacterium]